MVQRVFVCLPSVTAALRFYHQWARMQQHTQTCLLECGSHCNRKWIMDLDASAAALQAAGLFEERVDSLDARVVELGVETVAALLEFIPWGCHFAVVSRHSVCGDQVKKLSWHVTLMAEAPHEAWRLSMLKAQALLKASQPCLL